MIGPLIIWALCVFFWFWLWNHGDIVAPVRQWVEPRLPGFVAYLLSCGFCLGTWITLAAWPVLGFPFYFVLATPPITMFMACGYNRLKTDA